MIIRFALKVRNFFFKPNHYPVREGKKQDFIYIHINKTGGTSIAKAIGLPNKTHLTVKEVLELVRREEFDQALKFASVRKPWSKVVSHYKYRIKTNQTKMQEKPIPFKEWVKKTYGEPKDPFYYDIPKMFQPQVEWLKDHEGNIVVDHILKMEHLSEDFKEIAMKIGIKKKLPHLNKTKKEDYKKNYNEETRAIVAEWFKEDIESFNYTF